MSDRLTVVFDDPDLYRKLKVRAAEEGVAMKRIIERALSAYLEQDRAGTAAGPGGPLPVLDWGSWEQLQAEIDALPEEPSPDASDVKHQLYGFPRRRLTGEGWQRVAAEEPAVYDASPPDE